MTDPVDGIDGVDGVDRVGPVDPDDVTVRDGGVDEVDRVGPVDPDDVTDSAVDVEAPAKLTLSLRITGVRDDGYHLIDAEMVTLELADRLRIEPLRDGDPSVVTASGPFSTGMPLDGSNLILRALALVGRSARVHVHKEIPHGGGLGGGSADAAAILRWAGFDDLGAASRLGADVPFCLVGGRARVRGIGEIVDPLPSAPSRPTEPGHRGDPSRSGDPSIHVDRVGHVELTLVIPPLAVSTPAAYRAWDELAARDVRRAHDGVNELEAAAIVVEPLLAEWRDRIESATGVRPTLAGSGATWFLRGRHDVTDALADATVVITRERRSVP